MGWGVAVFIGKYMGWPRGGHGVAMGWTWGGRIFGRGGHGVADGVDVGHPGHP